MKKKILILCISMLFILLICSGCTQNKQDNINVEKSVRNYSEDIEEFNNLNEESTKKLFILKTCILHKSLPCRGVKRGLMIGRHL